MKVRDSFSLNPVGNTSKYTDFINYIDTSSVNAGLLSEVSFLEDEFPSRAQRLVRPGDILYSSVRPNLRHYYLYNDSYEHAVASTGFVLLRNNSSYNTRFAFYYLSTNEVVKYLSNIAELSQSTFPSFSSKDIGKIDLPDIDRKAQDQIVSILSAYDNLIEVNNKRIKILEQMAENLYKEWFVRFRFPGHETSGFENGIPKGWNVCRFSSIANVLSGGTPSTDHDEYYGGNIPFYTPKDSSDDYFVFDTISKLTEEGLQHCNSQLYPKNTIMITARGTVGNLNLLAKPMAMNQSCYALTSNTIPSQYFLFFLIKREILKLRKMASGGVFDTIIVSTFDHIKVTIPDKSLIMSFDMLVSPILDETYTLLKQNRNLIRQRDLLLPRLMSGKLEV